MKRLLNLIIVCIIVSVAVIPSEISFAEDDAIRLYVLNVGKADCIILQACGKNYLIDTGREQNYPFVENALNALGITRLDGVFLTHTDVDHAGGLLKLSMSAVEVEEWYAAGLYYEFSEEKHPLRLAAAIRGRNTNWLYAGDIIRISDNATLAVLGPIHISAANENNNSLVLRFDSPDGSILLTGDMKSEEEASLISAGMLSKVDVLKVGHHGDNGATSAAFAQIIKPQIAVISTSSDEEQDTPDSRVLKRLYNSGCKTCVITQDFDDAVLVTLNNGVVTVENVVFPGLSERKKSISMSMDAEQDTVILYNSSGKEIDLDGFVLYAMQNDKSFKLKDATIAPYSFFVIGSVKSQEECDYSLPGTKRIWNKNKHDAAILYDSCGRPIAVDGNGLSE